MGFINIAKNMTGNISKRERKQQKITFKHRKCNYKFEFSFSDRITPIYQHF